VSTSYIISGCSILTDEGLREDGELYVSGGHFVDHEPKHAQLIDAEGCTALPGIIDLHGDGFERELRPRPGVGVPMAVALASCDAAVIAHGITTYFYAITDGFEPGIRSRSATRELLQAIEQGRISGDLRCDSRVHIRHERVNTEDHDELLEWITSRRIDLLSLNHHLPAADEEQRLQRYAASLRQREKMGEEELRAWLYDLLAREPLGLQQTQALAAAAQQAGLALASHDDDSLEKVAFSAGLGVSIAEFPSSVAIARACREQGAAVMFGAPNILRGGSHLGLVSASEAVAEGVCDLLVSDYHFPSLLRAPFVLVEQGLLPLEEAWALVSRNPARAAGLEHKGRIAPGCEADFILVDRCRGFASDIQAVFVAGRPAFSRLGQPVARCMEQV
jgi:alpha-D-ribose 1-methylphosphonate 5-triphosphate diphosphatase